MSKRKEKRRAAKKETLTCAVCFQPLEGHGPQCAQCLGCGKPHGTFGCVDK